MTLFLKSNALRKTIKDKKKVVKDLDFFDLLVRGGGKKFSTLKSFIWYTVYYVELLTSLFVPVYTVRQKVFGI